MESVAQTDEVLLEKYLAGEPLTDKEVYDALILGSVAGEIAGALKAEKLLVLTDVKGIYADYRDEASFISTLSFEKAQELIIRGNIDGGMIPKVKACITALSGGAKKTHIIDGRAEHTILMEIFSDEGVGTEVVKEL